MADGVMHWARLGCWLLIKFSSQLMQQRRCEQLPAHFIPKTHTKYLMRKNLLTTKFHWLNKYISDNNQQPHCLSTLVNIQQKHTFNPTRKNHTPTPPNPPPDPSSPAHRDHTPLRNKLNAYVPTTQALHSTQDPQSKTEKSFLFSTVSSNLSGKSKLRVSTEPSEVFLEERDKSRNKSLMMRSCRRKAPCFFEKENRKTFSYKPKIKSPFQAAQATFVRRHQQLQKAALTPWAVLPDQLPESCDLVLYS